MSELAQVSPDRERFAQADAGYLVTATGITWLRELDEVELEAIGRTLAQAVQRQTWALIDWLTRYGGRDGPTARRNGSTGSAFARAAEITGFSRRYLAALNRIGEAFGPDERYHSVHLSMYEVALRVVTPLRHEFLTIAAKRQFTILDAHAYLDAQEEQLRTRERALVGTPMKIGGRPTTQSQSAPVVIGTRRRYADTDTATCPACHHVFTLKGAVHSRGGKS